MSSVYQQIIEKKQKGQKMLAVLVDPDKFDLHEAANFLHGLPEDVDLFLVGGSEVAMGATDAVVGSLKNLTSKPVVIFPGDVGQISQRADAMLFLSLLSGDNPEYLVGQQVKAAAKLKETPLEVIPVGYILIDGGNHSSVARVTGTRPMKCDDIQAIANTALAAQLMGKKLIYLEAGSGAVNPVSEQVIRAVRAQVALPLMVGGGIRQANQLNKAYAAGADLVVMGNVFEK
jgi:putative glycerol-1-phosphate prenyltransferase